LIIQSSLTFWATLYISSLTPRSPHAS